jgi:hypothetical protein
MVAEVVSMHKENCMPLVEECLAAPWLVLAAVRIQVVVLEQLAVLGQQQQRQEYVVVQHGQAQEHMAAWDGASAQAELDILEAGSLRALVLEDNRRQLQVACVERRCKGRNKAHILELPGLYLVMKPCVSSLRPVPRRELVTRDWLFRPS